MFRDRTDCLWFELDNRMMAQLWRKENGCEETEDGVSLLSAVCQDAV